MEWRVNCPRPHNGMQDTGRHLYYNSDKQVWYCFSCGYSGRGACPGDEVPVRHQSQPIQIHKNAQLLHDLLIGIDQNSMVVRAARKYLESHHVNPEQIAFKRRLLIDGRCLIFPIYRGSKIIYFQKRDLFSKSFVNPPVESKPLFWTHERIDKDQNVFLVEAFLNACRIEKFSPAVATLGKLVSDEACSELAEKCNRITVLLDACEQEASIKIACRLKTLGVKHVYIATIRAPQGTDVCDLSDRRCSLIMAKAGK